MLLSRLSVLVVVSFFRGHICRCTESYITKCDTVQDFKDYEDVAHVSEVMIGSEYEATQMDKFDIHLHHYPKLLSMMVVNAVSELDIMYFSIRCEDYELPLKTLIFYGNIIKNIHIYQLPLMKLKKMGLANNQIEEVLQLGLVDQKIDVLDLSDNLMEVVVSNTLPKVNKVLKIKNNKLTYIEDGSFSSDLETLMLDNNRLRSVSKNVFNNLTNLQELTLSHNRLSAIPEIKHLTKLVNFDISHNDILFIMEGTFNNMSNLRTIDLSNNMLDTEFVLPSIVSRGDERSILIFLAMNRLPRLNFEGVSLGSHIWVLYGNPWDCHRWSELHGNLTNGRIQCDTEIILSGGSPFCLVKNTPADWRSGIDRFHKIVRKNEEKARCAKTLKKRQFLKSTTNLCT